MLGGHGPGVPAPKRLDSLDVKNEHSTAIKVTVSYDDHKNGSIIKEEAEVPPGGVQHFGAKILDMGSWQAVAPVVSVHAAGGGHETIYQPDVPGVVKCLTVNAVTVRGGFTLQQQGH